MTSSRSSPYREFRLPGDVADAVPTAVSGASLELPTSVTPTHLRARALVFGVLATKFRAFRNLLVMSAVSTSLIAYVAAPGSEYVVLAIHLVLALTFAHDERAARRAIASYCALAEQIELGPDADPVVMAPLVADYHRRIRRVRRTLAARRAIPPLLLAVIVLGLVSMIAVS